MQAIVMRYNVMSSRIENGQAIIHVAPFVLVVPIKGTLWPFRRAYTRHVNIEAVDIGAEQNLEFNADYHVAIDVKIGNRKGEYDWYLAKKFEQLPDRPSMRYLGLCRTPAYVAPALPDEDAFTCKAVMLHLPSGPVLRDIMIRRGRLHVRNTFDGGAWEDFGEIENFTIRNGSISSQGLAPLEDKLAIDEQRIVKRLIDGERRSG